ncbi:hypothetical protein GCK72_026110 [Caenorhabditis remanei]|uniref:Uncharacterized protein n=1 Tax=Caenorhabditis remanei TaxID=31234 RepID=A0A6A5G4L8_CAERE|nr:hypothetical protein GCK72_026110 [Caenorhabditis remanei]KAF1749642.1 hypothetical protein GCK72_026110 [Caenorhabditis remanei]
MFSHLWPGGVWRPIRKLWRFQKWQHPGLAIGEDLDLTCYFFRPADQEGPVPQIVKRAANPKNLYQNQHPVAENNNPWSALGKEAKEKWRGIGDQVRAEQDHQASKGLASLSSTLLPSMCHEIFGRRPITTKFSTVYQPLSNPDCVLKSSVGEMELCLKQYSTYFRLHDLSQNFHRRALGDMEQLVEKKKQIEMELQSKKKRIEVLDKTINEASGSKKNISN